MLSSGRSLQRSGPHARRKETGVMSAYVRSVTHCTAADFVAQHGICPEQDVGRTLRLRIACAVQLCGTVDRSRGARRREGLK